MKIIKIDFHKKLILLLKGTDGTFIPEQDLSQNFNTDSFSDSSFFRGC